MELPIPPLGKKSACLFESSLVLSIVIYSTFPKVGESGRRSTIGEYKIPVTGYISLFQFSV